MLWKFLTRPADIVRVRCILSEGRFDALVVQTSHDHVSLIRDLSLLLAVRHITPCIVFHFHGGHSEWLLSPGRSLFKRGSSLLFRLSDGVLVDSSTQRSELEQFAPAATFREVLIPFVIDPEFQRKMNPPNDVPVILFAGRLTAKKGIFDVLEAVARIKERQPFRLVIAGTGPEARRVKAEVDALGLRDRVKLCGWVQSDNLAELYRSADVFVLPTYETEGFPTVIGEAMSAGLPIVATRNRGIVDHLNEGVNALLVSDRDPNELADALDRVLRDDELRASMSAANLEKIKRFAPERVGRQYLTTLHEIATRDRMG
jgi:glycosyltransferase involved in cell wall biosynthesis